MEAVAVPFRVLSQKNITGGNALELVPVWGEKHFKPHLLNRNLVPPRGSFQNF